MFAPTCVDHNLLVAGSPELWMCFPGYDDSLVVEHMIIYVSFLPPSAGGARPLCLRARSDEGPGPFVAYPRARTVLLRPRAQVVACDACTLGGTRGFGEFLSKSVALTS